MCSLSGSKRATAEKMNKGCRPDPKTMPVTKEYAEGHERTFANRERATPGRYVWDAEKKEMIPYSERTNTDAINAGVLSGRHYENTAATDGTDIGSRRKHKEYMKRNGMAHMSDYNPDYKERLEARKDREETKSLREAVEKTTYKLWKP